MSGDKRQLSHKYNLAKRIRAGETQFGNWVIDPATQTITHAESDYWVPLHEMTSSAQTLDYIYQIAGKPWASEQDVGYFVALLGAIIDPQATICSFGTNRKFDMADHLNKYFGPMDISHG